MHFCACLRILFGLENIWRQWGQVEERDWPPSSPSSPSSLSSPSSSSGRADALRALSCIQATWTALARPRARGHGHGQHVAPPSPGFFAARSPIGAPIKFT